MVVVRLGTVPALGFPRGKGFLQALLQQFYDIQLPLQCRRESWNLQRYNHMQFTIRKCV